MLTFSLVALFQGTISRHHGSRQQPTGQHSNSWPLWGTQPGCQWHIPPLLHPHDSHHRPTLHHFPLRSVFLLSASYSICKAQMRIIDERDSALLFFSHSKLQWNKVNPTSQVTARENVGSSVLAENDATVSQTFPKFNTVDPTFCKLMLKIKN